LKVPSIAIIVQAIEKLENLSVGLRSAHILAVRVSIITAVRNGESEIVRTLDSVATQDYRDIEHIVVDGDSRDATLELVRLHGARVSQCISEPDGGVYDAFNKGLRVATGEVIAFLNAGDTYLTAAVVSRMVGVMTRAGVDATFADVEIVDPRDEYRVLRYYSSRRFAPARMRFGLMPAHPSLFMRRAVYETVGEYDTTFKIAGDYELCLRAFVRSSARYRYVHELIVRMPGGGLSNRGWRSKLAITREMMLACKMNAVSTSYLLLSMRFAMKAFELR
jgi:glycosyltransferase involved in cell wall biosynthesis